MVKPEKEIKYLYAALCALFSLLFLIFGAIGAYFLQKDCNNDETCKKMQKPEYISMLSIAGISLFLAIIFGVMSY